MRQEMSVAMSAMLLVLCGCSEPIYITRATSETPASVDEHLIMPYVTKVETSISVYLPLVDPPKLGTPQPITISAVNFPKEKRYLFFKSNTWYNSSAEFATNSMGLPSKSDTASTQQVTTILGEAGAVATGLLEMKPLVAPAPAQISAVDCAKALVTKAPYGKDFLVSAATNTQEFFKTDNLTWQIRMVPSETSFGEPEAADPDTPVDGFYVYEPSSVRVRLECYQSTSPRSAEPLLTLPEQVISAYLVRRRLNPLRAFWTSPQDTYTMSDGVLTGHKYTEQSAARTLVELITSPIRAALPPTTTQTTTSVQTGGGKPDQTTRTINVSTAPPHGP